MMRVDLKGAGGARDQAALLPPAPGVYRFRDAGGRVLYLGRATSLRSRVTSYWGDLRDRAHLAPMVARVARLEAVACDSAHEAAWLERNLLQARKPPWNRAPDGGQESEVWIRLSDDARHPGMTVVYEKDERARNFGPYLGGRQVRLAVSGLCRVLPLNYAGGELTGTHRELARIRGVGPGDRAALAAEATAVLGRDPAAVARLRASLVERRDAASVTLAFELAARLQEEAAALDWVTAEQKVTRPGPADHDACGWSDGTLARFEIRAGRLAGWTLRTCGAAAARRHVTATPPEWAAFAQRNAELAARLGAQAAPVPEHEFDLEVLSCDTATAGT
jgi:excinuclease ABC subunit C